MLFNTLQFALFFIIVYSLYLSCSHRWQNRLLLVASYVFYGTWDWRFLSLIFFATTVDYFCALRIHSSDNAGHRRLLLACSMVCDLSILGFFKYFNFFAENIQVLLGLFGIEADPVFLKIILPVGISFYTFQTMSYTIDVYRQDIKPTRRFFDYALYVSFFPQLIAGPIERARHLLPQVLAPRNVTLEKFSEGCYLIYWGLFQKVYIADNLARIVDPFYASSPPYNGINTALATFAFAIQVFCDFAGYSNIARGLGKCMGFDIVINFNLPFFATSTGNFWRQWHISLSDWFRDYLYMPLVIRLRNWEKGGALFSLLFCFTLIGLWHGAEWTFLIFGFLQGLILCVETVTKRIRKKVSLRIPAIAANGFGMLFTFCYFCFTCIFFRSQSVFDAVHMLEALVLNPLSNHNAKKMLVDILFYAWPLFLMQLLQWREKDLLAVPKLPVWQRAVIYFIIYYLIAIYGVEGGKEFIYFHF